MTRETQLRAAKVELAEGRLKVESLADGQDESEEVRSSWGCLYAVSYGVSCGSAAERLLERVEGVAQETYRRSPGGITNRLRQAVRNANRYLYLRNRVRGEEQAVLAALACVAVRGGDAYACGVGPHSILVVGRGRVRGLGTGSTTATGAADNDCEGNGHLLGCSSHLADPRFSYRQILPGEQLLIVAGDEEGRFKWAADQLRDILDGKDLEAGVQALGELVRQQTAGSALLIRLEDVGSRPPLPESTSDQEPGGGPPSAYQFLGSVLHKGRSITDHSGRRHDAASDGDAGGTRFRQAGLPQDRREPRRTRSSTSAQELRTQQAGEESVARLTDRSIHFCGRGAAQLVSVLLVVRAGTWRLLHSLAASSSRASDWVRRHRLVERLARGAQLALLGVFAGMKELLVGILPERYGSSSTYAATARPMPRARVLRFHPSGASRLLIGGFIVLVVFVLIGASAIRVRARLRQAEVDRLTDDIAAQLAIADREEDVALSMAALSEAQYLLEQAPPSQQGSPELTQLSQELATRLDGLMGVMRLTFSSELEFGEGEPTARRLLVCDDYLYLLDQMGQLVRRYELDRQGHLETNEEPWTWELPESLIRGADSRILDIDWMEAAGGRTTPALMMLVSDGYVLEMRPDGSVHEVGLADSDAWQSPEAIGTYEGNLYVLDTGYQNILKYVPQGDDYEYPPVDYLQEAIDINWAQVVDMAIDGYVYLLLSDGSVAKFAGGKVEPFAQEALYPAAASATSIFATPDSRTVLVADPQAARLVEFSKEGASVQQYRAGSDGEDYFAALGSFTVDARSSRLIVSTATGLYSAQLPDLRQDDLDPVNDMVP